MLAPDADLALEQVDEAVQPSWTTPRNWSSLNAAAKLARRSSIPRRSSIVIARDQPIPVFTRELSNTGIGLLHDVPLERGEVAVSLQSQGRTVTFRTYIVWCKPCGRWYLSGGQFLGMADG